MTSLFPDTPWSLVARVAGGNGDTAAVVKPLLERYWQPVFESIKQGWQLSDEQAIGLVDDFLHHFLQPEQLQKLDPAQVKLRSVVRDRLIDFMQVQNIPQAQPKTFAELSWQFAEHVETPASLGTIDEIFDEQWTLLLFHRALLQLQSACHDSADARYQIFVAHDVHGERPSNQQLARRLDISADTIDSLLFAARRQFRGFLLVEISQYNATQADTQAELAWLLT